LKTTLKSIFFLVNDWIDKQLFSKNTLASLVLLFLIAFSFLGFRLYEIRESRLELESELAEVEDKIVRIIKDDSYRKALASYLDQSDPNYLASHVESRHAFYKNAKFLKEIQAVNGFRAVEDRILQLEKPENAFSLVKVSSAKISPFCENIYALKSPLVCAPSDIKAILAIVEGAVVEDYEPAKGRPDLCFKVFRMKKDQIYFEIIAKERMQP
jgi:hypothetical protein